MAGRLAWPVPIAQKHWAMARLVTGNRREGASFGGTSTSTPVIGWRLSDLVFRVCISDVREDGGQVRKSSIEQRDNEPVTEIVTPLM